MKQRVITLIIILLAFFSILSANYQVLNKLNITDYLYSKMIFEPKAIESTEGAVEQEQKCTRDHSLSEISNFLVPARLILPYINK